MPSPIKTAVFPVAGMGTRFLPVTKIEPKEMLPIVDRPLIQYVVEEAIEAGITRLIFVTSSGKHAIEDYFDSNYELERRLEEQGKTTTLNMIKNIIPEHVQVMYVRQPHPLGLGDAVLRAKHLVQNESFAVLLADDILVGQPSCLQQMIAQHEETAASVVAVEKIDEAETDKYGIVSLAEQNRIVDIIEKPSPIHAPSCLGVIGRYVLTPAVFDSLQATQQGVGGELQLTDAIAKLLTEEQVTAYAHAGKRFDCGSPLGFVKATLHFALRRPGLGEDLKRYLAEMNLAGVL